MVVREYSDPPKKKTALTKQRRRSSIQADLEQFNPHEGILKPQNLETS